jgi:hypothetical protein
MSAFVLQAVDKFLANYHIGHAVFLLFLLALPAGIVMKSAKITALTLIAFGGLFIVVPSISDAGVVYSFFGVALIVAGPMAYTVSAR